MYKTFLFIGLLLFVQISNSQPDTIIIKLISDAYNLAAIDTISNKTNRNDIRKSEFVSIPVFNLHRESVKDYKCGANLMKYVSFFNNPKFQWVVMYNNETIILRSDIEYFEDIKHTLIEHEYLKVEKNIFNYIKSNKNEFVFGINGLNGFWSIKDNRVYKLKTGLFNEIILDDAKKYYYLYDKEYLYDVSYNKIRFGYPYKKCNKKIIKKNCKDVFVLLIIE